jgi:hypothetical protein
VREVRQDGAPATRRVAKGRLDVTERVQAGPIVGQLRGGTAPAVATVVHRGVTEQAHVETALLSATAGLRVMVRHGETVRHRVVTERLVVMVLRLAVPEDRDVMRLRAATVRHGETVLPSVRAGLRVRVYLAEMVPRPVARRECVRVLRCDPAVRSGRDDRRRAMIVDLRATRTRARGTMIRRFPTRWKRSNSTKSHVPSSGPSAKTTPIGLPGIS